MILQNREDSIRCIRQHDHGLLSGEFARAWSSDFSLELLLAIALHDLAWGAHNALDQHDPAWIPFNEEKGRVHDFITMPGERKLEVYQPGHDIYEAIHPYVGLLLSLHYGSFFPDNPTYAAYLEDLEARKSRLCAQLGYESAQDARVQRDWERLKFFDLLSLFVCLRAPGSRLEDAPVWIKGELELEGESIAMGWASEDVLEVSGWPGRGLRFELPYRDVPMRRYRDATDFVSAWSGATERVWTLRVEG
jgi:hypothetical protein